MKIRTYKAQTKWLEGYKTETEIRKFKVGIDEPLELKGTNTAPNPVEMLLATLGGCVAVTYRAYARKFRIEIERLIINLEGETVHGGWTDEEGKERSGFKQVRYEVQIKTKAPQVKINQLHELVEKKCSISDVLINPLEVKASVSIS